MTFAVTTVRISELRELQEYLKTPGKLEEVKHRFEMWEIPWVDFFNDVSPQQLRMWVKAYRRVYKLSARAFWYPTGYSQTSGWRFEDEGTEPHRYTDRVRGAIRDTYWYPLVCTAVYKKCMFSPTEIEVIQNLLTDSKKKTALLTGLLPMIFSESNFDAALATPASPDSIAQISQVRQKVRTVLENS